MKTIDELKQKLVNFKSPSKSSGIRERLLFNYTQNTVEKLQKIVNETDEEELPAKLKVFFEENWTNVNNTCLSYTAISNNEINNLLCEIADWTAQELSKNKEEKIGAIELLMPTVNIYSQVPNSWPNLDADCEIDTKTIINTHILSDDGNCLIPVKLLPEILPKQKEQRFQPYFDTFSYDIESEGEGHEIISETELSRLIHHSNTTKSVNDKFLTYKVYEGDEKHLLGQLDKLCKALYLNSVKGRGTEDVAGVDVGDALKEFHQYYNNLGIDVRNTIPKEVKSQIDILLALALNSNFIEKDKKEYVDTEEIQDNKKLKYREMALKLVGGEIGTCLATRYDNLKQVMQIHSNELANISLEKESSDKLLKLSKQEFEEAHKELIDQVDNKQYREGVDNLVLTKKLIDWLGVKVSVKNEQDLKDIANSKPEDIQAFLNIEGIGKQIAEQFKKGDEPLVLFIINTKPAVLKEILSISAEDLFKNKVINNTNDLKELLIPLDNDRVKAVLQGLQKILPKIITNSSSLCMLLEGNSLENTKQILEILKNNLPDIIKKGNDFYDALRDLSPEQCILVCEAMKDKLISNGLVNVIEKFSSEQQDVLKEYIKEHAPELIQNGKDLLEIGSLYQNLEQIKNFWNRLEELGFLKIIKDSSDYAIVMESMNQFDGPEKVVEFNDKIKEKLPLLINDERDLRIVLKFLSPEQCQFVCENISKPLSKFINNFENFNALMNDIPLENRSVVYGLMKDYLPKLISNKEQLAEVLQNLSPDQCQDLCNQLKGVFYTYNIILDESSGFVDSYKDVEAILKELSPEQCFAVCSSFKKELSGFKKLKEMNLSDQQKEAVEKSLDMKNVIKQYKTEINKYKDGESTNESNIKKYF